jgi:hypothetical protein
MSYQIDPDADPIAACLLIFAKRGAAIRAEREHTQTPTQNEQEPSAENSRSVSLPAQPSTAEWRSALEA